MKVRYLLYFITVVVIIFTIIWEIKMQQWLAEQPDGGADVMRVDLFVLVPLLITLVALSLFRILRRQE